MNSQAMPTDNQGSPTPATKRYSQIKMRVIIYLFIVVSLLRCTSTNNSKSSEGSAMELKDEQSEDFSSWEIEKIEGSKLKFTNGKELETYLFNLQVIGLVQSTGLVPYIVMSGRGCNECDANTAIYIHSPAQGSMKQEFEQVRYQYPGVETHYENGDTLYSGRAFYGNVLANTYGAIWYQNILSESGELEPFTFLVRVKNGVLKDTIYPDHLQLEETKELLSKKGCFEIEGMVLTSEP